MKSMFRKSMKLAGLEVRRIREPDVSAIPSFHPGQNGKILEFLGPSAAGKSYLMERLHPLLQGDWHHSDALFGKTAPGTPELDGDMGQELRNFYCRLYLEKAKRWDAGHLVQRQFTHQLSAMEFHLRSIRKNLFLDYRTDLSVINDEGLVSNFFRELLQLAQDAPLGLRLAFRRRYIVFVRPTPERMLDNIRQRRIDKPGGTASYSGWSDAEIVASLESMFEEMELLLRCLEDVAPAIIELRDTEVSETLACCRKIANSLS